MLIPVPLLNRLLYYNYCCPSACLVWLNVDDFVVLSLTLVINNVFFKVMLTFQTLGLDLSTCFHLPHSWSPSNQEHIHNYSQLFDHDILLYFYTGYCYIPLFHFHSYVQYNRKYMNNGNLQQDPTKSHYNFIYYLCR